MLTIEDLNMRYARQTTFVLKRLDLLCPSIGITALAGSSGVGKSTLIAIIAGIYEQDDDLVGDLSGEVSLDDHSPQTLRGPCVSSWVPQKTVLFEHLSAVENVLLPLTTVGLDEKNRSFAAFLLGELGLSRYMHHRPRNLSGGMRARVSLARALVSTPKYLFLDEPFVGLDLATKWSVYKLLNELRRGAQQTTILTTHDIMEAMLLCDRIVLLQRLENRTDANLRDVIPTMSASVDPRHSLKEARTLALDLELDLVLGPLSS